MFLISVSLCTGRHSNEEFILSNFPQISQIHTDFLDLCGLMVVSSKRSSPDCAGWDRLAIKLANWGRLDIED